MKRVVVVGCGGSGKTVLANQLGARLGLPVTHLDALYYDENWQPASAETFIARQRRVIDSGVFVLDGNYASTLPTRLAAADTVIFLDLPGHVCLAGVLRRRLAYRGGRHQDGVHDRITIGFVRYVLGYRRAMAPRVRAMITEHAAEATVHRFTTRRAATAWLTTVPHSPT